MTNNETFNLQPPFGLLHILQFSWMFLFILKILNDIVSTTSTTKRQMRWVETHEGRVGMVFKEESHDVFQGTYPTLVWGTSVKISGSSARYFLNTSPEGCHYTNLNTVVLLPTGSLSIHQDHATFQFIYFSHRLVTISCRKIQCLIIHHY